MYEPIRQQIFLSLVFSKPRLESLAIDMIKRQAHDRGLDCAETEIAVPQILEAYRLYALEELEITI